MKLHASLGWCVERSNVGKNGANVRKKEFSLKWKSNVQGSFSEPIDTLLIVWWGFGEF